VKIEGCGNEEEFLFFSCLLSRKYNTTSGEELVADVNPN
jgi:hypothetical protein